MSENVV